MNRFRTTCHSLFVLLLACMPFMQAWGSRTDLRLDSLATSSPQLMSVLRTTRCIIHPLFFRLDDDVVDMSYMGNDSVMRSFRHAVDSIGLNHIDSIRVVVQSSPEGAVAHNFDLSRRRAINTERYMNQRYPDLMSFIRVVPDGESWQALRRYIVTDTVLSPADIKRLVEIIDTTPDFTLRKKKLQATGKIYQYLYATYYPCLRNSIIATIFTTDVVKRLDEQPLPLGTGYVQDRRPVDPDAWRAYRGLPADTIFLRDTIFVRQTVVIDSLIQIRLNENPGKDDKLLSDTVRHDPVFALKTNLLFDAVTALNGELEVPVGKRHSLMGEVVWPWWLQKSHNRWCFELGSVSLEYRLWFHSWKRHQTWAEWKQSRRQPLRGGFIGLYVTGGYYDLQWKRHNGYQGEFYSAGLTIGVSRYVSRFVRMEFSIGGGYVMNKYRTYHIDSNSPTVPDADQHLYRDGRFRNNWFGPTKAKISLSVLLHHKCRKKGGAQ